MKTKWFFLAGIALMCSCSPKTLFDQTSDNLYPAIDNTGKITALEGVLINNNIPLYANHNNSNNK